MQIYICLLYIYIYTYRETLNQLSKDQNEVSYTVLPVESNMLH